MKTSRKKAALPHTVKIHVGGEERSVLVTELLRTLETYKKVVGSLLDEEDHVRIAKFMALPLETREHMDLSQCYDLPKAKREATARPAAASSTRKEYLGDVLTECADRLLMAVREDLRKEIFAGAARDLDVILRVLDRVDDKSAAEAAAKKAAA